MCKSIAIVGFKESGKTTVVEGLVTELKDRGYSVGTLKHVPKKDFSVDQEETDSWRHSKAGAHEVAVLSPNELAILRKKEVGMREVLRSMDHLDFVLIEGRREAKVVPKIAIARDQDEVEKLNDDFTVGFIENGTDETKVFGRNQIENLADFVVDNAIYPLSGLDCGNCGFDTCQEFTKALLKGQVEREDCVNVDSSVSLKIDGEEVALNSFVQELVKNTVFGMVSSLKKGEGDKIEVEVEKNEG